MYCWLKCPTCNNLIGHIFPLFKAMRAFKTEQEQEDNLLDIFELLHVSNWCCKTRLMSIREFNVFLHSDSSGPEKFKSDKLESELSELEGKS